MVEQRLCPNCGAEMDLSNVFISGKANCPKCGYLGLPVSEVQCKENMKTSVKIELPKEEALPKESADVLDMKGLSMKLTVICGGLLLISVFSAPFRAWVPMSALGMLIFGAAYLFFGRK